MQADYLYGFYGSSSLNIGDTGPVEFVGTPFPDDSLLIKRTDDGTYGNTGVPYITNANVDINTIVITGNTMGVYNNVFQNRKLFERNAEGYVNNTHTQSSTSSTSTQTISASIFDPAQSNYWLVNYLVSSPTGATNSVFMSYYPTTGNSFGQTFTVAAGHTGITSGWWIHTANKPITHKRTIATATFTKFFITNLDGLGSTYTKIGRLLATNNSQALARASDILVEQTILVSTGDNTCFTGPYDALGTEWLSVIKQITIFNNSGGTRTYIIKMTSSTATIMTIPSVATGTEVTVNLDLCFVGSSTLIVNTDSGDDKQRVLVTAYIFSNQPSLI